MGPEESRPSLLLSRRPQDGWLRIRDLVHHEVEIHHLRGAEALKSFKILHPHLVSTMVSHLTGLLTPMRKPRGDDKHASRMSFDAILHLGGNVML